MSYKKPQPLISAKSHDSCPVCGQISYSVSGVHPQCSVEQADAKRMKHGSKIPKKSKPLSAAKPWQRFCPKCKAVQHVRKKICNCGHTFAVRAIPPTGESEIS
ncbi:MAG TPA: hypothetical protein VMM56_16060 [Planctomycetaceae bacterium]|nr:hypothetical protein [Planctomycetaceae bacterium]